MGMPEMRMGIVRASVCVATMAGLSRTETHHPQNPSPLSEHQIKDPAPADDAEPKPRRARKPVGWSMIMIGVLVAVCAGLVWRRDGIDGVLKILTHDLWLFGEIMPRVLAGCLLGGFIAEILPHDKVSRALGPNSGLKGLLIGTAFGAILPGGPFTAYPVAAALLTVGADFGATIAMVVSWTLIGYGRAVAWELPILGTDFTLWRIVISLPIPVLSGALGRFVFVRMYPKGEPS
jgi:uncharacterized membrane protein YraQ (UPF0718 family)